MNHQLEEASRDYWRGRAADFYAALKKIVETDNEGIPAPFTARIRQIAQEAIDAKPGGVSEEHTGG